MLYKQKGHRGRVEFSTFGNPRLGGLTCKSSIVLFYLKMLIIDRKLNSKKLHFHDWDCVV